MTLHRSSADLFVTIKVDHPGTHKKLRTLISGVVRRIDDSPWASATVKFRLIAGSYTFDGDQHPPDKVTVTTDAEGRFSAYLWANESGLRETRYEVVLKGDVFYFSIPVGLSEAQLTTLINRNQTPTPENPDSGQGQVLLQRTELFSPTLNQTSFLLGEIPVSPELSLVYLNGVKSTFPTEYVLDMNVLQWKGVSLEPSDLLETVYYINN